MGGLLVQNRKINPVTGKVYTVQDILVVYYSIGFGILTVPQVLPVIPAVIRAQIAGKAVYDLIERKPEISNTDGKGVEKIDIGDGIRFEHVQFRYPTAPEGTRDILSDANFTIKSGTSTAIIGPSGSGKSTIV